MKINSIERASECPGDTGEAASAALGIYALIMRAPPEARSVVSENILKLCDLAARINDLTSEKKADLGAYTTIATRLRALRDDCRAIQPQGPVRGLYDWLPSKLATDIESLIPSVQEAVAMIEGGSELERDEEQFGWEDVP